MLKKLLASSLAMILLVMSLLTGIIVFSEQTDDSNTPIIDLTLNADGTSSFVLTQKFPEGNAAEMLEYYGQGLETLEYTVEASESGSEMFIKKTTSAEEGYVFDLSMYGVSKIEFVSFDELFSTKYGIRTSVFDMEKAEATGEKYFVVNITTPVGPSYTNAAVKSGKTSSWDIMAGNKNVIDIRFTQYKIVPIIIAVLLIAIIAVFLLLTFGKKKSGAAETEGEAIADGYIEESEDVPADENPVDDIEVDAEDASDDAAEETTPDDAE